MPVLLETRDEEEAIFFPPSLAKGMEELCDELASCPGITLLPVEGIDGAETMIVDMVTPSLMAGIAIGKAIAAAITEGEIKIVGLVPEGLLLSDACRMTSGAQHDHKEQFLIVSPAVLQTVIEACEKEVTYDPLSARGNYSGSRVPIYFGAPLPDESVVQTGNVYDPAFYNQVVKWIEQNGGAVTSKHVAASNMGQMALQFFGQIHRCGLWGSFFQVIRDGWKGFGDLGGSVETWMFLAAWRLDTSFLQLSKGMVAIYGESTGVGMEVGIALQLGMPVTLLVKEGMTVSPEVEKLAELYPKLTIYKYNPDNLFSLEETIGKFVGALAPTKVKEA